MRTIAHKKLGLLIALVFMAGLAGCSSSDDPVEPAPDTSPPSISSVTATDLDRIVVVFNKAVEKTSAEEPSNYTLTEAAASPSSAVPGRKSWRKPRRPSPGALVGVLAAELQTDNVTVVLTTEVMDAFAPYTLEVSNVEDLNGNAITSVSKPIENEIKSGRIFTIAGTGLPALGVEDVDPLTSELYLPQDITIGPQGLVYIVDWNNHRIRVIENGLIRTVVGSGLLGNATPGNALEVGLNHPTNVTFDLLGDMYVSAWHNSKILKIDKDTGWLDIYCAFSGARGFFGDGGPAYDAILNLPSSVIFDDAGNLLISDQANSRIRMINPGDTINTIVGNGQRTYCGDDGPAIDACLYSPSGQNALPAGRIDLDQMGNLYIADTWNVRVRMVDTNGIIRTIAGNGTKGHSGDDGNATSAQLDYPADVAIGPNGHVYIADKDNHCIRMVDLDGIITTVAGVGDEPGYSGDGGPATEALMKEPFGLTVDGEGNIYIADTKNHRIRIVYE